MDTQVITILSIFALVMPVAIAQETKVLTPANGKAKAGVVKSTKAMIGEEKLAWIVAMRSHLSISKREIGPFGLAQDPESEIAKPRQNRRKPGAFLNAIAAIKVNTVMPSENMFTIGSREFSEGDVFPIIRGQRQFNIEIVAIKKDTILFKNVDTGEYVKRNLHTLPKGMSKNAPLNSIEGVVPANKKNETPLNLDDEPIPVTND